jgi:poly(3-hydroxybutyrate) depolymerase
MCTATTNPKQNPDSESGGDDDAGGEADTGTDTDGNTDPLDNIRSPGCGKDLERPDPDVQQTIDIEGTTRYYLLDIPESADNETPHPLIFALHGYDMNNVAITGLYNFKLRSKNQAIAVYPQGDGPPPGDTAHWGDHVLESRWTADETNYTFIRTLMTDLEERLCIDKTRVFITGFSMGGMFTNALACAHNDWFRGFAPVEGGGPESCADTDAKPAVIIHQGTADTIVGPEMGEASRDFWVLQNGCEESTVSSYNGCVTYEGCQEGRPVVYCVGDWDHTIDSVAVSNIWTFFSGLK